MTVKNMEEDDDLVYVRGLWVPREEEPLLSSDRYRKLSPLTGTIDLDIGKVAESIRYCKSHRVALDIGSHVGSTAVLLAKHFESVNAFEAIPRTAKALQRNTQEFENVTVHNCAISNGDGELFFEYYPAHGQITHALLAGQHLSSSRAIKVGPVPARPIDAFEFSDVDFIKIDVEGLELEVVQGARQTILRSRPVLLVEQGGNEAKHFNREQNEASRFLRSLGMSPVETKFTKDVIFMFE
jgi:FkbM family methyltransferase